MLTSYELGQERTYTIGVPGDTWGARVIDAEDFVNANHASDPAALEELADSIYMARANLMGLSRRQKAQFGGYLRDLLGDRFPDAPRNNRQLVNYVTQLDDEPLTDVLRLHYGVVLEQQEDALPLFLEGKERFVSDTLRGIDEGWISQDAGNVKERMREIRFQVGDIGLTHLQRRGGLAYPTLDRIVLSQGLGRTRQERYANLRLSFDQYLDHEGNHVAFDRKFKGNSYSMLSWFIEGMAEHLSLAKEHGQPDILAPGDRGNDSRIYVNFRNFIHFLATKAPGGKINADYFTRAYTADNLGSEDWLALEGQLDNKWGAKGFLFGVGRAYMHNCELVFEEHRDWDSVQVWDRATVLTQRSLEKDPSSIFGPNWRKPPRYIGRAVLGGN